MMTLRQLGHFASVYDLGTIRQAAEISSISQPALTSSIAKLEDQFGSKLFQRTPAGMVPTEFADLMIGQVRAVLNGVADLRKQADLYTGLESGSLRIGVQQGVRQPVLQRFLPDFISRYPEIAYTVIERTSAELVPLLLADEIDLIVAGYRGLDASAYTRTVNLRTLSLQPIVRAGHPLAVRKSVPLADLLDYPMAAPEAIPPHLPIFRKLNDANRKRRSLPHVSCSDYTILTDVILTTDTFMAGSPAEFSAEIGEGRLVVLNVPEFSMKYLVAVVDRVEQFRPPVIAEFISLLEKHLSVR